MLAPTFFSVAIFTMIDGMETDNCHLQHRQQRYLHPTLPNEAHIHFASNKFLFIKTKKNYFE